MKVTVKYLREFTKEEWELNSEEYARLLDHNDLIGKANLVVDNTEFENNYYDVEFDDGYVIHALSTYHIIPCTEEHKGDDMIKIIKTALLTIDKWKHNVYCDGDEIDLDVVQPLTKLLESTKSKIRLQVWWVPQIPMEENFIVDVESVTEGVKVINMLANYDLFQTNHNIKPDYSNIGGLQMFEDDEWVDWYDEDTGIDDPVEYVKLTTK